MEEGGNGLGPGVRAKKRRKESKNRKRNKRECNAATAVDAQPVASRDHVVLDTTSAGAARHRQENTAAVESRVDKVHSSGKKRPRQGNGGEKGVVKVSQLQHPFPTDYCDHFETPLQAYRDVEGALAALAKQLGKKRQHLRIWDPYVRPKYVTCFAAGARRDELCVAQSTKGQTGVHKLVTPSAPAPLDNCGGRLLYFKNIT